MEEVPLRGKVAVVTGASSGFGVEIAQYLAREGVKVGLLARRFDRLQELEAKIKENGGEALAVQCDVTKRDMVFDSVDKIRKTLGKIDFLINNAGLVGSTQLSLGKEEKWHHVVDVNVTGTLHCLAACLPDMLERKSGHVIGMSSVLGRTVTDIASVYCASKHFMMGHCAAMRRELAPLGIKVTTIQPGLADTEILVWLTNEEVKDKIEEYGVLKSKESTTILTSKDVASAVLYALKQPKHVAVNEIQLEPQGLPFAKC